MTYSLATSYVGESLLSGFNWFDGVDPSHGYVAYQNQANAEAKGLFSIDQDTGVVRLGVDHTNAYDLNQGRPSIRLESKAAYNHGLFVADFLHMPPSQCGLWPAFWSYGTDWPRGGEIDIIEGANTAHRNLISAHTADGCSLSPLLAGTFSGEQANVDCAVGSMNIGCGFTPAANDTSSYGDGFNAVNGGVYAMQWDSKHIKVWHFDRGEIPQDIAEKEPNPGSWKSPSAVFGGSGCDVDSFFKDMSLVININFCGDWGNAVWGKSDQCNNFAPTCTEYVANNPGAFANAYWDVRYIDAYRLSSRTYTPKPTWNMNTTSSSTRSSAANATIVTGVISSFVTEPLATGAPMNPTKIGRYTCLGCFGSSTGFQSFRKARESDDMTLEKCADLCNGSVFAGTFENTCYCASELDAGTRAMSPNEGGVCNHPCRGDDGEFCGGLLQLRAGMAIKSTFLMKSSSLINSTVVSGLQGFRNTSDLHAMCAPWRRVVRRGVPDTHLLTMYGAMADDVPQPPPPPPPMAPGSNATYTRAVTETAYRTVYPLQSVKAKFVLGTKPPAAIKTAATGEPAATDEATGQNPCPVLVATMAAVEAHGCENKDGNKFTTCTLPPLASSLPIATRYVADPADPESAAAASPLLPSAVASSIARSGVAQPTDLESPWGAEAFPTATAAGGARAKLQWQSSLSEMPVMAAAPPVRGAAGLTSALGVSILAMAMVL